MADVGFPKIQSLLVGKSPEDATGWPHPAELTLHVRGKTSLIGVSMGPHIVNVGGHVTLNRLIVDGQFNERFAEEFDSCQARWLIPYLVRLAAGEDVTEDEIIAEYSSRYGHPPRVVDRVDRT